jgi:hypothetical protein
MNESRRAGVRIMEDYGPPTTRLRKIDAKP